MKINSISPVLYQLSYFKYTEKESKHSITLKKSQYVYRVLMIDKGYLNVSVNNKNERIQAGDAIYLLPGDIYRLLPCGSDFSLYNLSFYFRGEYKADGIRNTSCVFLDNFCSKFCLPKLDFVDAPILNESGIFRSIDKIHLRKLYFSNPSDKLYPFYSRSAIFSIITELLTAAERSESDNSPAKQIIEYIRRNPEKDLSGNSLSSLFSYHKNYINKLIKRETGKSMSDYIRYVKIEYAKALISEGMCSLSELTSRLGYYDYSHFYKAFVSETGVPPKEYLSANRS